MYLKNREGSINLPEQTTLDTFFIIRIKGKNLNINELKELFKELGITGGNYGR
jgi:hypothetical protein